MLLLNTLYSYIPFLVISFAWYKENNIWKISFNAFPGVLPTSTCTRATGNLWRISLGANILSRVAKSKAGLFACVDFNGNILLLKALRVNSRPW